MIKVNSSVTSISILLAVVIYVIISLVWYSLLPRSTYHQSSVFDELEKDISSHSATRRVVLLVGPHKTSSTSEQTNIIRWINDDILKSWSWPAPEINDNGACGDGMMNDRTKVFYPYIDTLNGNGKGQCLRKFYASKGQSKANLISDFEQGFRNAWMGGDNLVIASESIDFVSADKKHIGDLLMTRILHGMPWNSNELSTVQVNGSNDDITVVVNFRTPRRKHLISLWHECCMKNISFKQYLTTYVYHRLDKVRALDSLSLVEVFLNKGLNVILIDMAGVSAQGYDISNVVACDVLRADCDFNKSLVGDTVLPSVMNVKNHPHNMTNYQLREIEKTIRNYDCKFENITDHEKLTILYPDELMRIFDDCKNIALSDRILTRKQMKHNLRKIAYGH